MFIPITSVDQLPAVGLANEVRQLDFKRYQSPDDNLSMGKDVAAFANGLGGVLLIGAQGNGKLLANYVGVDEAAAKQLAENYERVAKERCRPSPQVVTHLIRTHEKKLVVAVNVWPSAHSPVGFCLGKKETLHHEGDAWVFPLRVGSQTRYLQPDQFANVENVNARRAAAMLTAIPPSETKEMALRFNRSDGSTEGRLTISRFTKRVRLESVDLMSNVAKFSVLDEPIASLWMPLDWVETVWKEGDAQAARWVVVSTGAFKVEGNSKWLAVPR